MVSSLVNFSQVDNLRTLEEGALRRNEHLVHHVLLATGEDEIDIGHELDIGSQQRFGVGSSVVGDLLELVNGNVASFTRLLQVFEDVAQRLLFLMDCDVERERRHAGLGIKGHCWPEIAEKLRDFSQGRLSRRIQFAQHILGKQLHKLLQALGSHDVDVEAAHIRLLLLDLSKHMMDEPRFTDPAGGYQCDVALIVEAIHHFAGLFLAVTKVLCTLVSIGHKRIVYQFHIVTSYFTQRKLRNFLRQYQISSREKWHSIKFHYRKIG